MTVTWETIFSRAATRIGQRGYQEGTSRPVHKARRRKGWLVQPRKTGKDLLWTLKLRIHGHTYTAAPMDIHIYLKAGLYFHSSMLVNMSQYQLQFCSKSIQLWTNGNAFELLGFLKPFFLLTPCMYYYYHYKKAKFYLS